MNIFITIGGDVIDLPWIIVDASLVGSPNGVIFLTAVATEMRRIELYGLVLASWGKTLCIESDMTGASRLEGRQHFTRPADELMQFEGKSHAAMGCFNPVSGDQEFLQARSGQINGTVGVLGQTFTRVTQRNGFCPDIGTFWRQFQA